MSRVSCHSALPWTRRSTSPFSWFRLRIGATAHLPLTPLSHDPDLPRRGASVCPRAGDGPRPSETSRLRDEDPDKLAQLLSCVARRKPHVVQSFKPAPVESVIKLGDRDSGAHRRNGKRGIERHGSRQRERRRYDNGDGELFHDSSLHRKNTPSLPSRSAHPPLTCCLSPAPLRGRTGRPLAPTGLAGGYSPLPSPAFEPLSRASRGSGRERGPSHVRRNLRERRVIVALAAGCSLQREESRTPADSWRKGRSTC
jgi:hypothetical protein